MDEFFSNRSSKISFSHQKGFPGKDCKNLSFNQNFDEFFWSQIPRKFAYDSIMFFRENRSFSFSTKNDLKIKQRETFFFAKEVIIQIFHKEEISYQLQFNLLNQ